MLSAICRPGTHYPAGTDSFSPHERYPEYRYPSLASRENRVYEQVRQLLAQAGLDDQHYGTAAWNPLGGFIEPGQQVFVLCNFVYHRRPGERTEAFHAKCTHASVLRAIVDYLLIAVGENGRVLFGNAPLQGCEWNKVLEQTGAKLVEQFYATQGAPVKSRDLRLHIVKQDRLGRALQVENRDSGSAAVEIDLASTSLLREHYGPGAHPRYRVLDYDPRRTERYHAPGSHRYVINRAVLESDVVLSLPKLKTHEKVGITCGLKGFVGIVGHKDCLAHHRFGGASTGGDEYPGRGTGRLIASRFHDWTYGPASETAFSNVWRVLDRNLRRLIARTGAVPGGGWHGNDTAWRMSLDLGRIVHYGDVSGVLRAEPQRRNLCLIDGILGGEGNGPLRPTAVHSNALVFSDNVAVADRAACRLMGIDPQQIPLVREAFSDSRWPLGPAADAGSCLAVLNGNRIDEADLPLAGGRPFRLSDGWRLPREAVVA